MHINRNLYLRFLAMEHGLCVNASELNVPEILKEEGLKVSSKGTYELYTTVGVYKQDIESLDSVASFKNIKTLYNLCKLFETGISLYKPSNILDMKEKIIKGSLECYSTYARKAISDIIKITAKSESIFTEDGTIIVSSKMVQKEQFESLIKSLFFTMLGQDIRMLFLKGNITSMNVTSDIIKKNYLDSSLGLVFKLADYLDTTANNLLGLKFNIDFYAKNGLFVMPSLNSKSVSVQSLTDDSEVISVPKSSLDDFCDRISDLVSVDSNGRLLVNSTPLQEILL